MNWGLLVAALPLLLGSGALTAAEAAAFRLGSSRLRTLAAEGFKGSDALARVRLDAASVRVGVRLLTRTLNLIGAVLVALGLAWSPTWFSLVLVIVAAPLLVLLLADVLPHIAAARYPVRFALTSAWMLLAVARTTRFLTRPLERMEARVRSEGGGDWTSERRELKEIQELGRDQGVLEASENLLVERAFRLDELSAWDVMVPRVDIFAWHEETKLGQIIEELPSVPHSRVPVYRDSVDDVTGIVYVREAYQRHALGDDELPLKKIAREPFFVPGSLPLTQLLRDFQLRRIHMGIVADEFGGTDGLVTLEDVLEELVGEIHDETDVEEEGLTRIAEGVAECDGGVDIRDINLMLELDLPNLEHRSLNGFILEELGYVPDNGEALERSGARIEVLEATETQVVRARLTRLGPTNAETES